MLSNACLKHNIIFISDGSLLPKDSAQFISEKGFSITKSDPIIQQCVSVYLSVCLSVCLSTALFAIQPFALDD